MIKAVAAVAILMFCNLASVVCAKIIPDFLHSQLWILLLILFCWGTTYLVRMVIWLIVGKYYQLSYIYPFLGINYLISYLIGIFVWHETFKITKLAGIILITIGILVICYSRNKYNSIKEQLSDG
ncbi:MAG: hypothetical protein GY750_15310 [Lentisphaerae bacterium]|nr:hypothetical protein [Lentisphaerota bacterium]MCP4102766.1 hypothetical protein [Lentisphaerota bacterium]